MRKFNIFLLSGLLLAACNTELKPTNGDNTEPVVEKRKRVEEKVEEKEETNAAGYKRKRVDSELVVILPEKPHEGNPIVENFTACSAESQEEQLLGRNGFVFYESELSDEVMLEIFSRLSVPAIAQASGVCRGWYQLSEEPQLWKAARLSIHGDYPEEQATRENAKLHWLRVHVNTLSDLEKFQLLVSKYQLNNGDPFAKYKNKYKKSSFSPARGYISYTEESAAQGNEKAIKLVIKWKMEGCSCGGEVYEKNPKSAFEFNERLVKQGNENAIIRKIKGLAYGVDGYDEDEKAAVALNERLVEQGDEKALIRKIKGLACGRNGYAEDPEAALILNERLIKQGNEWAMEWKFYGLSDYISISQRSASHVYGYDPKAAIELDERLVSQGNKAAIKRKIDGEMWSYEDDHKKAAFEFNDRLVEQDDEAAIIRKIK
ncbi:MAG: F-box protein [Candidatus Amoebophilus sp.]